MKPDAWWLENVSKFIFIRFCYMNINFNRIRNILKRYLAVSRSIIFFCSLRCRLLLAGLNKWILNLLTVKYTNKSDYYYSFVCSFACSIDKILLWKKKLRLFIHSSRLSANMLEIGLRKNHTTDKSHQIYFMMAQHENTFTIYIFFPFMQKMWTLFDFFFMSHLNAIRS